MAGKPAEGPRTHGSSLADLDRLLQAWQAKLTGGLSPVAMSLAWLDWAAHLAQMPGRQASLAARAWPGPVEAVRRDMPEGLDLIVDGGRYLGTAPRNAPAPVRGITSGWIEVRADGAELAGLLEVPVSP